MRRNLLLAIGAVVVIAGCGLAWLLVHAPAKAASVPANQAIPITAGMAELKDVPVFLTGLGTVQAFNTVTVKVRVDGQLDKVAFTEGQDVKAGDVLAQIDSRAYQAQLEQALAKKQLDEAQLANARLNLDRYVTLEKTSSAPVQQVDNQRALVAQLEAQVKLDQGAIDNAKTFVDYCTITSPIDGRTGIRLVDQGNIVHATDPSGLVVITQIQPISVIFTLPEDQLSNVFQSMTSAPLKVIAITRSDQRQLADGTLGLVDNQIDQNTGTIRLKATFPNKDYSLWPGQFVNVRLLLRTLPQVVTVPSTAVQRGPDGMYVYTIGADSTVAMQPVSVLQMTDGISVIDNGLGGGHSDRRLRAVSPAAGQPCRAHRTAAAAASGT